jgi:two-component system chemotaxis response regulator CheB
MIRVLLAEDSAVTREYLGYVLDEDPGLTVVGVATNGREAVELAERLRPDVIVMDVHMPVLDGYDATREIMQRAPTPIVMATASSSREETRGAFSALEAGALVLLDKPPGPFDPDHRQAVQELIRTVKLMAEVKVVRHWAPRAVNGTARAAASVTTAARIVAIGASTGGPQVLAAVLGGLPRPLEVPVVLVQHISEGFIGGFAEWLGSRTAMDVVLAVPGSALRRGTVHVAGGDGHLEVTSDGRLARTGGPPVNGFRPSITCLFDSVAAAYGRAAVGVLLTGMGRDGADGLRRMREAGARTIAQDEATSVVYGLPGEAVRLDAATDVLAPDAIAQALAALSGVRA